jgi:hypothetical protein
VFVIAIGSPGAFSSAPPPSAFLPRGQSTVTLFCDALSDPLCAVTT